MLYELSDDDATTAFEAIASNRFWSRCQCDLDVGFVCDWCKASTRRIARDGDEGHKEDDRAMDAIYRYGKLLKRKAAR